MKRNRKVITIFHNGLTGMVFLGLLAAGIIFAPSPAGAVKFGDLEKFGEIVSADVFVPTSSNATIFTVPANRRFFMTQLCRTLATGEAGVVGTISMSSTPVNSDGCVQYFPGVEFAEGEGVSFFNPEVRNLIIAWLKAPEC